MISFSCAHYPKEVILYAVLCSLQYQVVIDKSEAKEAESLNMNILLFLFGWVYLIEIVKVKYLNKLNHYQIIREQSMTAKVKKSREAIMPTMAFRCNLQYPLNKILASLRRSPPEPDVAEYAGNRAMLSRCGENGVLI